MLHNLWLLRTTDGARTWTPEVLPRHLRSMSPASGGESIRIAYRAAGSAVWHAATTVASSSGAHALTLGGVSPSTDFIAQWAGEGAVGGAGTPAVRLTVTRR